MPATARRNSTGATNARELLPDGPERNKLYREMSRLMEVDTVWMLTDSRYRNVLMQPYVVGFKKHPVLHAEWLYIDDQKSIEAFMRAPPTNERAALVSA